MFKKINYDKLGLTASTICLIHCMILPVLIAASPFLVVFSFVLNPAFELFMAFLALFSVSFTLCLNYSKHKKFIVPSLLVTGVLIILFKSFNGHSHHDHEVRVDWVMILGSCLLVVGHVINHNLCKACPACKESECTL